MQSRDLPCVIQDNTGDGIEGCVGLWILNFATVKLGHETGDSKLFRCKKSCQDLVKEIVTVELVEKQIGLSRLKAAFDHLQLFTATVWIWVRLDFFVKFRALSDVKFSSRISKSNLKKWLWWKLSSYSACCLLLFYPLMLFISMRRSQTVEDVDTSEAAATCKSKQMHYHWKCFFRRGSNLYNLRDVWATQSQGWIHVFSTDESINPWKYWNPTVVRVYTEPNI